MPQKKRISDIAETTHPRKKSKGKVVKVTPTKMKNEDVSNILPSRPITNITKKYVKGNSNLEKNTRHDWTTLDTVETIIEVKDESSVSTTSVQSEHDIEGSSNVQSEHYIKASNTEGLGLHHIHNRNKCYKFVGAHMSIAGGMFHSIEDGNSIGCKAVGIFLKNQRQWNTKPLEDSNVSKFKEALDKYPIFPDHILPHGSYLMNCGSPNKELREKSRDSLLDDAYRCEKVGIKLLNFHPGSTTGRISAAECCQNIADCINYVVSKTSNIILLLENMCGQGNTIGSFKEIANIIFRVKNKMRIGVCLDTCHAYAYGYDLNGKDGYEAMISEFDKEIGLQYLKGVHLNDSKGSKGCHLDRHENIGKGKIGLECFRWIMNDHRFNGLPMILETPVPDNCENIYQREIALLYSLCNH